MANAVVPRLLTGVQEPSLLQPPVNVLRLSLHPKGLAPQIANLGQWRAHLLARLHRQIEVSGDAVLAALLDELRTYPVADTGAAMNAEADHDFAGIAVPLQFVTPAGTLSLISTTIVFGTPVDLTLASSRSRPSSRRMRPAPRRCVAWGLLWVDGRHNVIPARFAGCLSG